ncbi:hypothetical protein [Kitasatospora sp. LaBMicrA B282]|uniref:hypothetical protein n=1 Tax=Kitasatospora sp. LaBMicrA B282 TaxID=3420949 RepID=UPI003D0EE5D4
MSDDAPAPAGPGTAEGPGPRVPGTPTRSPAEPPLDLHADFGQLAARLRAAVDRGHWLDAYLLCAGAGQLAEDRLQGVDRSPRRLADRLTQQAGHPLARTAGEFARDGLDLAGAATGRTPARRAALARCTALGTLAEALAERVLDGRGPDGSAVAPSPEAAALTELLHRATAGRPPAGLLRPPGCFAGFDLHPDDLVALAELFAADHPARERPLLVLGVRTAGSYLAPLVAVTLRRLGYRAVHCATTRPGLPTLPGRAAELRRLRAAGGTLLLVADPPLTGGSLAAVAARAERAGFDRASVVPLFACFTDTAEVPPALARYPCRVLPGTAWRARALLRPPALARTVARLLAPGRLLHLAAPADPGPPCRAHHLAVPLTAEVAEPDGRTRTLPLRAEWVGVGYLGAHTAEVAARLPDLVPRVHGFADGVLLRERLPGEEHPAEPVTVWQIARYTAVRQDRLAVPLDRSPALAGRRPVWEVAAELLAPALGRLDPALRPTLLHPLARAVLTTRQPCVVDGRTRPEQWAAAAAGSWRKTDFAEGAFSLRDLAGYDAAFDLAGAADDLAVTAEPNGTVAELAGRSATAERAAELRTAFARLTGERIPDARWCLLRLVHVWDAERLAAAGLGPPVAAAVARRAKARIVQRFLAGVYLADLDGPGAPPPGPWCVLTVDGVLESEALGFPAAAPQGMLALRALRAHGCRVLLATGRPLPELRDRCAAYRLPGGVAEYGARCLDAAHGLVEERLPPGWRAAEAGTLRARLAELPGVRVDPAGRWCVRASVGDGARRTRLPAAAVDRLLADRAVDRWYTVVQGASETDFLPRGTDPSGGVRTLLRLLSSAEDSGRGGEGRGRGGEGRGRGTGVADDGAAGPPALAVGAGRADLALLRWARLGLAPGNGAPELRSGGVPVLRRRHQAGLAEAVGRLIGHRPGGCPQCKPLFQPPETEALLAVLAVPGADPLTALAQLTRATARAVRHPSPRSSR